MPPPPRTPPALALPGMTMSRLVPSGGEGLLDPGPGALAHRHRGDHGGHADDDAQRGEQRAGLAADAGPGGEQDVQPDGVAGTGFSRSTLPGPAGATGSTRRVCCWSETTRPSRITSTREA